LTETFRSALALALEEAPTSPQPCTAIKSLRLQVSFFYKPRADSEFLLLWAYMMLTYLPSMGLLMPGKNDADGQNQCHRATCARC